MEKMEMEEPVVKMESARMIPIKITDENNTIPCVFCKSVKLNELDLGPMYKLDNITSHYYCMLFSAGLNQTGNDDEGILGFMPESILKEVRRSSRLKCTFCNVHGASIGCCKKSCKYMFHFTCGLENNIQYQFLKSFEAYCPTHAKPQEIPEKFKEWVCPICLVVEADEAPVLATCCKGAVFHKDCIKASALNAGYFFKCPMCNEKQAFVDEMRRVGIFVPEQDASWEREPGAFEDLLQYSKCDAAECECPRGREYSASKGGFILACCRICGSTGVHRQCGKMQTVARWACEPCLLIEAKAKEEIKKTKKTKNAKSRRQAPVASVPQMEEEEVDLSKIIVSPSCAAYFPYDKDQLERIGRSSPPVIPDWRGYTLRSQVVDWLGPFVREAAGITTLIVNKVPPNEDLKLPPVILGPRESAAEIERLTMESMASFSFGTNSSRGGVASIQLKAKKKRKSGWKGGNIRKRKISKKVATVASLAKLNALLKANTPAVMTELQAQKIAEGLRLKDKKTIVTESNGTGTINNQFDSPIVTQIAANTFKTEVVAPSSNKTSSVLFNPQLLAFGSKRNSVPCCTITRYDPNMDESDETEPMEVDTTSSTIVNEDEDNSKSGDDTEPRQTALSSLDENEKPVDIPCINNSSAVKPSEPPESTDDDDKKDKESSNEELGKTDAEKPLNGVETSQILCEQGLNLFI